MFTSPKHSNHFTTRMVLTRKSWDFRGSFCRFITSTITRHISFRRSTITRVYSLKTRLAWEVLSSISQPCTTVSPRLLPVAGSSAFGLRSTLSQRRFSQLDALHSLSPGDMLITKASTRLWRADCSQVWTHMRPSLPKSTASRAMRSTSSDSTSYLNIHCHCIHEKESITTEPNAFRQKI